MPGRGHKRKGGDGRVLKRDFKKSRENVWDEKKSAKRANGEGKYAPYEKENKNFEDYYKAQKIVPEGEWDAFIASLKTPLPTSFRINGRCASPTAVHRLIPREIPTRRLPQTPTARRPRHSTRSVTVAVPSPFRRPIPSSPPQR